ncbi:MAG TPA: HAMP domain-containing sensor histidine kinase, partial [Mucilaginibacter sp.]|nr:HAMP domain-containing sensor histidine kinase [Mucilaginibacter sp.]
IFNRPQYSIIKNMTLVLLLSVLLIISAIAGFNYLIKTIQKQRKLAELKDDFINNMTHELKTPIATLTVAIEGLQKFNALNDPEKTQRYLQTSRTELSRLNELVTKVLNISAFENEKINLVKENINVDELIEGVIASEQLKTDKKIDINYQNNGLTTIIADKLHFRNILVNLIDNAIKYSGKQPQIEVTCIKAGSEAVFSVKDNGPGIPKAQQTLVFDKFHRIPTGNVHNVKGTGLGLSYVKYIVEAHGGTVAVKSEINAGSEFIISIPLN